MNNVMLIKINMVIVYSLTILIFLTFVIYNKSLP